jgi:hydroxymethylbilane synthase
MSETITAIMPTDIMLPAVAQGAIGIETLRKSGRIKALLAPLNDADTAAAISCERAFLATLEGSCKTPIAGHATLNNGTISFSGETLTLDGNRTFRANRTGAAADAHRLGRDAAAEVKENGGSLVA